MFTNSLLKTMFRAVDMVFKSIRKFVLKEIKDYSNVKSLFFKSNHVVEANTKCRLVDAICQKTCSDTIRKYTRTHQK